jgi:hypothetical protein
MCVLSEASVGPLRDVLRRSRRFAQNKNVMPTARMLATAIIKISEPLKLLITCNMGTSWCPRRPKYKLLLNKQACEIDLDQKPALH